MKKNSLWIFGLAVVCSVALAAGVKLEDEIRLKLGLKVGSQTALSSSAIFEVVSTSKGSRPVPVMTSTQRGSISSPGAGLQVYNSTSGTLNVHNGSTWNEILDGTTVQTATNKSLSGSANTFTNIPLTTAVTGVLPIANGGTNSSAVLSNNRVMKSSGGAVIEAAAITAARALISDANGIPTQSTVTSTELANVSGTTSSLCGISQSCTQTSKTFTSPVINGANITMGTASNSNRLGLATNTTTNLAGLSNTAGDFAYDTTQNKPVFNNGAGWNVVGSGSGGGTNFITNPDAEAGTTGWGVYGVAGQNPPADGSTTVGSVHITWTTTTSTPLTGTSSFLFTKDAVNRQGEGASYAFSIDNASQAKVMSVEFDYVVASGTFVAGSSGVDSDLEVWIYDVTNARLIQPTTYKLFSSTTSPPSHFTANFQTASNSTSYRLIFHTATTSASAYTVKFDSITVSPSKYVYGTPITDWQQYTLVIGATTTPPTKATVTTDNVAYWRRVGGDMEITYHYAHSSATGTAAGSGTYLFPIPTGYTIDTTRMSSSTGGIVVAGPAAINAPTPANAGGWVSPVSTTQFAMIVGDETTGPTSIGSASNPITGASIDYSFRAQVPILGWSSTVQMSDSAPQANVNFYGTQSSQAVTASVTDIAFTSVKDSLGGWSTNIYTAKTPGDYHVDASWSTSAAGTAAIYKNGSLVTLGATNTTGSAFTSVSFTLVGMSVGDTISLRSSTSATLTSGALSIARIGGNQTIGATEFVGARYTNTAGTSIANSGDIAVPFATKDYDSHSFCDGVNTCTVPMSGKFQVDCTVNFASSAYAASNTIYVVIYKNGSAIKYGPVQIIGGTPTALTGASVHATLNLIATDAIVCRTANARTAGATLLSTVAGINSFEISRVGL